MAEHTDHLIFLSSYRVYADEEHPIRETSPQLWDITEDKTHFEETNSYSAFKSQCEQLIRQSPYVNKVTIVRPLIAFYHGRLSFITTPAYTLATRALKKKKILVPREAQTVVAGYCFAGNIGKEIAHLVLNPKAYGEAFTLGTGENCTWGEIAVWLQEALGAQFVWVDAETYLQHATPNEVADRWGLYYDRLLNRSVDVSKVMAATGLTPNDFLSVRNALAREVCLLPTNDAFHDRLSNETCRMIDEKTDAYFAVSNNI